MYTLKNDYLAFSLNSQGLVTSILNVKSGKEYCAAPGEIFRLIYAVDDYYERSVNAACQDAPEIRVDGNVMTVYYDHLKSDDRTLDISLRYTFTLDENHLRVSADLQNNCEVMVAELQTTVLAGIHALGDDARKDYLMIPRRLGGKIPDPAHADFFKLDGQIKRKYERPDHRHSDLDLPYPGYCCMQWFCLTNDKDTIYVGNHDTKHRTICMHIERRTADNTLRLGICQYPFLEQGESYTIPTIVYALCDGTWHKAAKLYRKWINEDYGWIATARPDCALDFQGWQRLIFRTQSGEYNYRFKDIPWIFDDAQKAGLNTLFTLGWPRGGFGKMRPDYYLSENDIEDFKKGIEYVHSKGGKLLMYVSYHALDRRSEYYQKEGGEETLMRDLWGNHICYAETYAYDGTYRKMLNNPYTQFCTCSGSDKWQEKMIKSANYCLDLGADGVLYDLGGTKPLFCFAEGHDHKKANESRASKANRYKELRKNIKRYGDDKIIMQEHCIDIYAQHMDFVQPPSFTVRGFERPEMFRYTFPEVRMTNRNLAMDEINYHDSINYTFLYGIAFDMTIFRANGVLREIPNYTAYMKEVIALREKYKEYFFRGTFQDEDGFTPSSAAFAHKAFRTADGKLGIAVWNWSDGENTVTYTNTETGLSRTVTLKKDAIAFIEL